MVLTHTGVGDLCSLVALCWGHQAQIIMYLHSRWGQHVAVWIELNNYSNPPLPLPSLPRSLAALQWSQQYCRETCQPLWSSHQGRRERERDGEKERDRQHMRQSVMQHAGHWGWCWRIWDLFPGSWRWQDRQLTERNREKKKWAKEWQKEGEWTELWMSGWGGKDEANEWKWFFKRWFVNDCNLKKKKHRDTVLKHVLVNAACTLFLCSVTQQYQRLS